MNAVFIEWIFSSFFAMLSYSSYLNESRLYEMNINEENRQTICIIILCIEFNRFCTPRYPIAIAT